MTGPFLHFRTTVNPVFASLIAVRDAAFSWPYLGYRAFGCLSLLCCGTRAFSPLRDLTRSAVLAILVLSTRTAAPAAPVRIFRYPPGPLARTSRQLDATGCGSGDL